MWEEFKENLNRKTFQVYESEDLILLILQYAPNWSTDLTPNMAHLDPLAVALNLWFYCSNCALVLLIFWFPEVTFSSIFGFWQAVYSLCLRCSSQLPYVSNSHWLSSGLSLQSLFFPTTLIYFEEDKCLFLCVPWRPYS